MIRIVRTQSITHEIPLTLQHPAAHTHTHTHTHRLKDLQSLLLGTKIIIPTDMENSLISLVSIFTDKIISILLIREFQGHEKNPILQPARKSY